MSQDEALEQLYGKSRPEDILKDDSLMSFISDWNLSSQQGGKLASQTSMYFGLTIFNLFRLVQYLREKEIIYKLRRSILSTLSVELSFCITRSMQSYVTACEYSTLSGRTEWDRRIMCTDIVTRKFALPSDVKQPSKYYNACVIHYTSMPSLKNKGQSKEKKVLHSEDTMKSMRSKLAGQGESTGHKKIRSHCNTSHKKMWFSCDVPDCRHLPFHYPTTLESRLVVSHGISISVAASKLKTLKFTLMKQFIAERAEERRRSAQESGLRFTIIEEERQELTEEQEIELERSIHDCEGETENVRSGQNTSEANGDDIFPITDELLEYSQDLTDIFDFMQMEFEQDNKLDSSQSEFSSDQKQPIITCLVDCETINLYKFPDGCPCEISIKMEGTSPDEIVCSKLNPIPYLSPSSWSDMSIGIHRISPEDVLSQPLIANVMQAFYRLITVDKRCRCLALAYNAPFDDSRISSCAECMVPNFDDYDVVWLDARKLIEDELVCDDEGRIIGRTGKLSEVIHHRLKNIEMIDLTKVHDSRYDTYMMYRLLLQRFETEDGIREAIINLSQQKKGIGCQCIGGCVSCVCASEGSVGCSALCNCFGCRNPIKPREAREI